MGRRIRKAGSMGQPAVGLSLGRTSCLTCKDWTTPGIKPPSRRVRCGSTITKSVFRNAVPAAFCREMWVWEQLVAERPVRELWRRL